jgi:formylglycine-generating enzyme required for sulfatase activity
MKGDGLIQGGSEINRGAFNYNFLSRIFVQFKGEMMEKKLNTLISEEDATEVVKIVKSSEKKDVVSRIIIFFFLIVVFLGIVFGIIIITKNIAKKTLRLGQTSGRSGEPTERGLSVPRPSQRLALPGISSGGSVSSNGTPQNQAQAPASPKDMVLVPAGDYIMGWNESGAPVKANVPVFFMDAYEVTNQQYADFVRVTGHKPPADPRGLKYNIWKNGTYPTELADHPVVNVSYQDAEEYAKWVEKRLPTKEEWERANRGNEGFMYPWGNDYNPNSANGNGNQQNKGTTTPVGSFPYDRSPFGVFDMAGNVREWTATPYSSDSQRWKMVKGGSFEDGAEGLSSYAQFKGTMPAPNLGFRCVKDAR